MRYLMLVCTDPTAPPYVSEEDTIEEWIAEVERRKIHVIGDRLRPASDATTVVVRDGRTQVIDGPFAEAGEFIAGFDVLECADLDEAIEIAAEHPMARFGRLELRPVWPFE